MPFQSLSDLAVGSEINFVWDNSSLKTFILVHKGRPSDLYDVSCDGAWLLEKNYYTAGNWGSQSSSYKNSTMNTTMNSENRYENKFQEQVAQYIKTVKIPYTNNNNSISSGANGNECKFFALSAKEYGIVYNDNVVLNDGVLLDYFEYGEGESANQKRTFDSTSHSCYWTRSQVGTSGYRGWSYRIGNTGDGSYYTKDSTMGYRFAFILPLYLSVDENGNVQEPQLATVGFDDYSSGQNIGEKSSSFSLNYTIENDAAMTLNVSECVDGVAFNNYSTSQSGQHTIALSKELFFKQSFGQHQVSVKMTDQYGRETSIYVTFTKPVDSVVVSHATGFETEDLAAVAAMRLIGDIPEDAEVKIELTNNFGDDSPVWEDATAELLANRNYAFKNQTAANGNVFNFRITLSRGPSDTGGYLSGIVGTFQGADD